MRAMARPRRSRFAAKAARGFTGRLRQVAHGFQENFFQRVAAVRELPHQQILPRRQSPDGFDLHSRRQDDSPPPAAFRHSFGADLRQGHSKIPIVARDLELDEALVGPPLFFEVAMVHDHAVLENHGLVAHLLDVGQQVGADEHIHPLLLLHFSDELEHPPPCGRIEPVGRFVQHHQLRSVDDRLGELRHLLHSVRVRPQLPVARLSEPDVKQDLVCLLERCLRWEARQFGHLADERNRRHLPDERVVLGHVADPRAIHVAAAVQAQDAGPAGARSEEAEQGENQRGLARPVWAEQPHRLSRARNAETAGDPMEDLPPSKRDLQVF